MASHPSLHHKQSRRCSMFELVQLIYNKKERVGPTCIPAKKEERYAGPQLADKEGVGKRTANRHPSVDEHLTSDQTERPEDHSTLKYHIRVHHTVSSYTYLQNGTTYVCQCQSPVPDGTATKQSQQRSGPFLHFNGPSDLVGHNIALIDGTSNAAC